MLNPNLDTQALHESFKAKPLMRIANIFTPEAANRIHQCLAKDMAWDVSWYDHSREGRARSSAMSESSYRSLTPEQRQALHQLVLQSAAHDYQYIYNSFDIIRAHKENLLPGHFIHEVMGYLADDEFFQFIQAVTGDGEINRIDGHATRFVRGHFLKKHVDSSPFETRRYAYVLGFSPDWQADWGGLTVFMDDNLQPTDTFVPEYNCLTLFEVPVNHCVTQVASFCPAQRLSITGWFTIHNAAE